jgi:hypothetical protein
MGVSLYEHTPIGVLDHLILAQHVAASLALLCQFAADLE